MTNEKKRPDSQMTTGDMLVHKSHPIPLMLVASVSLDCMYRFDENASTHRCHDHLGSVHILINGQLRWQCYKAALAHYKKALA
jgi:hypothetical protein